MAYLLPYPVYARKVSRILDFSGFEAPRYFFAVSLVSFCRSFKVNSIRTPVNGDTGIIYIPYGSIFILRHQAPHGSILR